MMAMGGVGGNANAVEVGGGYNFNRIMDDHFEHYKRPASRERSVDQSNMPATLAEANPAAAKNRSSRASSRTRTPAAPAVSSSRTDINLDKRLEVRDDSKTNGGPPNLQGGASLKYRGPSQEVAHLGTVPKRTESMYFKPLIDEDPNVKVSAKLDTYFRLHFSTVGNVWSCLIG